MARKEDLGGHSDGALLTELITNSEGLSVYDFDGKVCKPGLPCRQIGIV